MKHTTCGHEVTMKDIHGRASYWCEHCKLIPAYCKIEGLEIQLVNDEREPE